MYFVLVLCFTCLSAQYVLVLGILGGQEISISEAPYQINYGDICGGVLIHKEWALTTAHCGTEETFIRAGSRYRQKSPKIDITTHIVHPRFSKSHEFDFDIQLLKFRKLRFSKNIHPIEISDGECGNYIHVTGWGFSGEKGQYNEILRRARLHIVPEAECQTVPQPWYNHTLTSRMFCAEGEEEDACQGDSGGPAVSYGRLVGISSFGYGCGRVPGVYVNVSQEIIKKWLQKHIIHGRKYVRRNPKEFPMGNTCSARWKPGLAVPVHRLQKTGKSLGVMGAKIDTKIPETIRSRDNDRSFTHSLKRYCVSKAYYSVKDFLDE